MNGDGAGETGLEIAVVGLAGRFPGGASVEELWSLVAEGKEAISFFSPDELAAAGIAPGEWSHPDYVPAYGVLADVESFDAEFFGYTPRDARLIDPQQRLFLECAWEALEGSGHLVPRPDELVGVYAGSSLSSYLLHNLLHNPTLADTVSEYELLLANDKDSIATRVSYHLDLRGPAVCVQTSCSSSLVAIHLGCQALLAHECDVALAGGVHVRVPTRAGYRYERGGIMSRDGHCRPFEAGASGTVGGNGAAVVVLRRLDDAVHDGDTIYAVVKGSAINNDGGVKVGYTAPSVDGQASVIRMAQDIAQVGPDTIAYVETHGTGTSLGDQIEFQALVEAFRSRTDRTGYCALGAVKALVGHLDAAAGATGFIKATLALHRGIIPPSPYFVEPHPELDLASSPFYVNTEPQPWPASGGPRRVALSSFGIGGTNAHVVLEEAPHAPLQPSRRTDHLLVLSARSEPALRQMREQLAARLQRMDDASLANVAYTLQTTRRALPHRLVVVCRDAPTAAAALAGSGVPAVRTAFEERGGGTVAFLFPGQGAQHVNMAADLYAAEPTFRRCFDECSEIVVRQLGTDLQEVVYPRSTGEDEAAARLQQTALAQPALFAVEYALAQLWADWGVRPAAMVGHSIGEYVAACLAGVFSLEDALSVVAVRGRLMQETEPGAMLAVLLPPDEIAGLLPEGVTLAAANAPRLSVVAGDPTGVESLAQTLRACEVECRALHTSHAFHSPAMDPVLEPFAGLLRRVPLRPPQTPIISNVTGRWLSDEEATDAAYWVRQLREPVRFSQAVSLLLARHDALLEVGPGTTLATLVRQHDDARGRPVVSSLAHPRRPEPDDAALNDALGQLWLSGVEIDWQGGWRHERRRRVALPTYPFERRRHWVDPVQAPLLADARSERTPAAPAMAESLDAPSPTGAAVEAGEKPTTAGPPAEAIIQGIWVKLLGFPDIGVHDNFFELGGHSLLGTKVIARIRDALAVELPAGALFEWPTISELAAAVERLAAQPGLEAPDDGELMPALLAEILALSPEELHEQLARERGAAGERNQWGDRSDPGEENEQRIH